MTSHDVHLVGSVPFDDSGAVFRCVCAALGERITRLPDGETGERTNWIAWQAQVFAGMPQFEAELVSSGYILRSTTIG